MPPRLCTTREAAALLHVSPRTVTNWVRAGRVPFVRLPGGEYRLPLEGLLDSLSGTFDLKAELDALDAGAEARRTAERNASMSQRLAQVHELSKQMTAIAGAARRR